MNAKTTKQKLDSLLVSQGLAPELKEARALIMAGQVLVDEQRVDKPGTWILASAQVRLKNHSRFVSRGGDKLWGAVEDLGVASLFKDSVVLDCGASTGGFSDCALQLGARTVYAVEIGFNQLAWKLRSDPRMRIFEQTDIRTVGRVLDPEISVVVADISFNSLSRMVPAICSVVPDFPAPLHFILLVKPQFELESEEVPAGGVVNDDCSRQTALERAQLAVEKEGFQVRGHVPSRLLGREGNREIFLYAERRVSERKVDQEPVEIQ